MRPVGTALELGMELYADEEALAGKLHGLHQPSVGREAGQGKTRGLQDIPVGVVELVAVTVALADLGRAVAGGDGGSGLKHTGVLPQPQRAALVDVVILVRHKVNHLVRAVFIEFMGIGIFKASDVPGVLDHGDLHAQANAEVGHVMLPGVPCRQDHALDAATAKAAGNDDAIRL